PPACRMAEVIDELIPCVDRVTPEARDVAERSAFAEPSFLADDATQALQLSRHAFVAFDDVVEHIRDASQCPRPVRRQTHRRIAALQRIQCAEDDRDLIRRNYGALDYLHRDLPHYCDIATCPHTPACRAPRWLRESMQNRSARVRAVALRRCSNAPAG